MSNIQFEQQSSVSMDLDSYLKAPVVIDNGSGYMKVGFSGEQKTPERFPSIVGRPKYNVVIPSTSNQLDAYIGKELDDNKRGLYKLRHPIKHGVIENWDDMELLWKHAYSLLKVSPNQCPVLLTEANQNPTKHRKKMLEIFFEKFQAPAAMVAIQGVLSLYATGKSTGIVLDSGDGVTHVVPVYEGYSIAHSSERIDFGGRDVTEHLRSLMRKSGVNMDTSSEFELVKNIKEKFCAISATPIEKAREKKEKYTLPDGQVVEFCNNEKEAGEILFSPEKIGLEYPSVVQLVTNSLSKIDIDLRSTLYSQIVLAGGNTMMEGFPERFLKEMKRLLPNEVKCRLLAPAKRDTMCWEGGSILASLPSIKNQWITRAEYLEQKQAVIYKKSLF